MLPQRATSGTEAFMTEAGNITKARTTGGLPMGAAPDQTTVLRQSRV